MLPSIRNIRGTFTHAQQLYALCHIADAIPVRTQEQGPKLPVETVTCVLMTIANDEAWVPAYAVLKVRVSRHPGLCCCQMCRVVVCLDGTTPVDNIVLQECTAMTVKYV